MDRASIARDIRAGDQQHEQRAGAERLAHDAKVRDELLTQSGESRAHDVRGVAPGPDRRVCAHEVCSRLLDRHARLHARDAVERVGLALLIRVAVERHPELCFPGEVGLGRQARQ